MALSVIISAWSGIDPGIFPAQCGLLQTLDSARSSSSILILATLGSWRSWRSWRCVSLFWKHTSLESGTAQGRKGHCLPSAVTDNIFAVHREDSQGLKIDVGTEA